VKRLRYRGCPAVGDGCIRIERELLMMSLKVVEKIDAQQIA
jgi:hypothetical protein